MDASPASARSNMANHGGDTNMLTDAKLVTDRAKLA